MPVRRPKGVLDVAAPRFRWTADADATLRRLYGTMPVVPDIALAIGCTFGAAKDRVYLLALAVPPGGREAKSRERMASARARRDRCRNRAAAAAGHAADALAAFLAPRVAVYAARFEARLDPLTGEPLPAPVLRELARDHRGV